MKIALVLIFVSLGIMGYVIYYFLLGGNTKTTTRKEHTTETNKRKSNKAKATVRVSENETFNFEDEIIEDTEEIYADDLKLAEASIVSSEKENETTEPKPRTRNRTRNRNRNRKINVTENSLLNEEMSTQLTTENEISEPKLTNETRNVQERITTEKTNKKDENSTLLAMRKKVEEMKLGKENNKSKEESFSLPTVNTSTAAEEKLRNDIALDNKYNNIRKLVKIELKSKKQNGIEIPIIRYVDILSLLTENKSYIELMQKNNKNEIISYMTTLQNVITLDKVTSLVQAWCEDDKSFDMETYNIESIEMVKYLDVALSLSTEQDINKFNLSNLIENKI